MAKIKGTTGVGATIAPASDTAKYPATSEQWHKGGFKGFATIAERDAMLANYKKDFMLSYVHETKLFYILFNEAWEQVAISGATATSEGGESVELWNIKMDASGSNAIYGASNTVQPPAIAVSMWKRIA